MEYSHISRHGRQQGLNICRTRLAKHLEVMILLLDPLMSDKAGKLQRLRSHALANAYPSAKGAQISSGGLMPHGMLMVS